MAAINDDAQLERITTLANAVKQKITAVADAVRGKTGGTVPMTLDELAEAIESIGGGDVVFGRIFEQNVHLYGYPMIGWTVNSPMSLHYTFPQPFDDDSYTLDYLYMTGSPAPYNTDVRYAINGIYRQLKGKTSLEVSKSTTGVTVTFMQSYVSGSENQFMFLLVFAAHK